MKIKSLIALVLFFSLLSLNVWAAAPQVASSIPADGDLTADPWTLCFEVTFNEPMSGAYSMRYNDSLWDGSTATWSNNNRTFRYCRNNINSPLSNGSYWFRLNNDGHTHFKSAATGTPLAETTISFTVTTDGSNDVDVTAPQVVSSLPADGATDINPTTDCLYVVFDEAMDTYVFDAWSVSNNSWGNSTSTWTIDKKTLRICRQSVVQLATGSYTFTLNPGNAQTPFSDETGNPLAETTITFSVSSNPASTYTYYIPYFASGNGFWSGVGISNNNEQDDASVSIMLYNADGTLFSADPPHLVPNNGQTVEVLARNQTATGWVKILSSKELSGLCFMGSTFMADIPFVSVLSNFLIVPHVAQNDRWDTSIMVCNPNNIAVDLDLVYTPKSGTPDRAYTTQILPALGSVVYDLDTLFPTFLPLDGGKVKLTASPGAGIAAFAIYTNQKFNSGKSYAGITAVPATPPGPNMPF